MSAILDLILRLQDNASPGLDRATDSIRGMDSATGGATGRFGAMQVAVGGIIGGAVTAGFQAITSGIGGVVGGMIQGNAQFETYNQQFGVLLGSAEAAQQRLDDLAQFGATTPFELPQVVEADKILQGFGLHSEEAAEKFGYSGEQIRTIAGDVASGTGASFQEMSLLLGKFSSGATGEAISRMQEMGITTREEMAGMGLEFSKSGQLMSPVPEAMGVVLQIMEDKYGGMMAAQSTTFAGMMSNLEDWKGATIRRLGEPIFEIVHEKLSGVLEFINSPATMAAIDGFADGLASGIGMVVDFVSNNLVPVFQTAVSFISGNVLPTLQSILEIGRFLVTGDFRGGIFGWMEDSDQVDVLFQIRDGLVELWGVVQSGIAQIAPIITQFVSWKDVLILLGGLILSIIVPAIASVVAGILSVAAPVVAAIAIIALLRTAWEENWGGIQEKVQAVLDFVVPLVTTAIQNIKDWWSANSDELLTKATAVWQGILDFVTNTLNFLWNGVILPLVSGIQAFWAEHGDAISAKARITWELIQNLIVAVINFIRNTIVTVVTAIQTFWQAHGETISNSAKMVWDFIAQTIKDVIDVINGIIQVFIDVFTGDWEGLGESLSQLWEDTWTMIVNFLDGLWAMIQPILASVWESIKTWWNGIDWGSLGQAIVQGIANGLSAGASAIADAARNAAQAALDAAKALLGISSPSRVFEQQVGRNMALGAARGVLAGKQDVSTAVGQLFGTIPQPAAAVVGGATQLGSALPTTLVFDFRGAFINSEIELERMVERALAAAGVRADVIRRTR